MPNFHLVYRFLIKISVWLLSFYSEVYIAGGEHVPVDGPVILLSSHHNDSLDVAALMRHIPHHRRISFWAKASLFQGRVLRFILLSVRTIPVQRNEGPRKVDSMAALGGVRSGQGKDARYSLFNRISYTRHDMVPLKDGAAWVALDYARWLQDRQKNTQAMKMPCNARKDLTVIPVGIVYTDKSRYQSRVIVEFGQPIRMEQFMRRYLETRSTSDKEDARSVVKSLTKEFETRMRSLTMNAPSWDVLYAARIAREIVYGGDRNIPSGVFVSVSQDFIKRLSSTTVGASDIRSLVTYYAILRRTGLTHEQLMSALPTTNGVAIEAPGSLATCLLLFRRFFEAVLHPSSILFLPTLLPFIPAYAAGKLGAWLLIDPKEEEAQAQCLIGCGGLAYGLVAVLIGFALSNIAFESTAPLWSSAIPLPPWWAAFRIPGMVAIICCTTWLLLYWYNTLIYGTSLPIPHCRRMANGLTNAWFLALYYPIGPFTRTQENHMRFQRLKASWKVTMGLLSPATDDLTPAALYPYTLPIIPTQSPFIKNTSASDTPDQGSNGATQQDAPDHCSTHVPSRKLIRHLLRARTAAEKVVSDLRLGELRS